MSETAIYIVKNQWGGNVMAFNTQEKAIQYISFLLKGEVERLSIPTPSVATATTPIFISTSTSLTQNTTTVSYSIEMVPFKMEIEGLEI